MSEQVEVPAAEAPATAPAPRARTAKDDQEQDDNQPQKSQGSAVVPTKAAHKSQGSVVVAKKGANTPGYQAFLGRLGELKFGPKRNTSNGFPLVSFGFGSGRTLRFQLGSKTNLLFFPFGTSFFKKKEDSKDEIEKKYNGDKWQCCPQLSDPSMLKFFKDADEFFKSVGLAHKKKWFTPPSGKKEISNDTVLEIYKGCVGFDEEKGYEPNLKCNYLRSEVKMVEYTPANKELGIPAQEVVVPDSRTYYKKKFRGMLLIEIGYFWFTTGWGPAVKIEKILVWMGEGDEEGTFNVDEDENNSSANVLPPSQNPPRGGNEAEKPVDEGSVAPNLRKRKSDVGPVENEGAAQPSQKHRKQKEDRVNDDAAELQTEEEDDGPGFFAETEEHDDDHEQSALFR